MHQSVGPPPHQRVQLKMGAYSLAVFSAESGELLLDIAVCSLQRVRRLGDVQNGFAIRHFHQWHVLLCDERNTIMTLLREKCDRMGLASDIIFGCSVPIAQVEKESGHADMLRGGATETWTVMLQPLPKVAFSAASWRNATARKRILMLTPTHLLECDADDCRVVWARELPSIRGLRRWLEEAHRFTVEFSDSHHSSYDSPHRDLISTAIIYALLASAGAVPLPPVAAGARAAPHESGLVKTSKESNREGGTSGTSAKTGLGMWSELPRMRLADGGSAARLVPAGAATHVSILAQQIVLKRVAELVDSGVLLGCEDEDILNPRVVDAAATFCSNCLQTVVNLEGRDVETGMVCVLRQLQGRKTLDRAERSHIISILECLQVLGGTKTGWLLLAKPDARYQDECTSGMASVVVGLASHDDDIVISSLAVLLSLVAPPFAGSHAYLDAGICIPVDTAYIRPIPYQIRDAGSSHV